jgi:hypothetical protein
LKISYVNNGIADADDHQLISAINSEYVPDTCLLNGYIVLYEKYIGNDPCDGCNIPREKCKGRTRKENS